jgi:hypothetical protein
MPPQQESSHPAQRRRLLYNNNCNDNVPINKTPAASTDNMYPPISEENVQLLQNINPGQKSTRDATNSAVNHFNAYLLSRKEAQGDPETIDSLINELRGQIDDESVINDEILSIIIDFCHYMCGTVPALRKDQPLKVTAKLSYFGKVKEYFMKQLPMLNMWNEHEEGWYSDLLNRIKGETIRSSISGDDAVPEEVCRGIVIRTTESKLRQNQRFWILDEIGADLESIVKALLLSNNTPKKYTMRAKLVMTYYGVGRGGEIKFLRWDEFTYDHYFSCVEGWWKRLKTLTKQQLLFTVYNGGWLCDFYHSMGAYFALDSGLLRTSSQSSLCKKRVFPDLYNKRNETVAKDLTNTIKSFCTSDEMKKLTSSRSIRAGGITALKSNFYVPDACVANAAGLSFGNSTDNYFKPGPDLAIISANALCDWPFPSQQHVHPPSLDALFGKVPEHTNEKLREFFTSLISHIFPRSLGIPQFQEHGILYPFLRTCLASFIMHHRNVKRDLGDTHELISVLQNKFKLVLELDSNTTADHVIVHWGEIIRRDFELQNRKSLLIAKHDADPSSIEFQRSLTFLIEEGLKDVVSTIVKTSMASEEAIVHRIMQAVEGIPQSTNLSEVNEREHICQVENINKHAMASVQCVIGNKDDTDRMVQRIQSDMIEKGTSVKKTLSFNPQHIKQSLSSVNYSFSRLIVDLVKERRLVNVNCNQLLTKLWEAQPTSVVQGMGTRYTGHYKFAMKLLHQNLDVEDRMFLLHQTLDFTKGVGNNRMSNENATQLLAEKAADIADKVKQFLKSKDGKSGRGDPSCLSLGKRYKDYLSQHTEEDPETQHTNSRNVSVTNFFHTSSEVVKKNRKS